MFILYNATVAQTQKREKLYVHTTCIIQECEIIEVSLLYPKELHTKYSKPHTGFKVPLFIGICSLQNINLQNYTKSINFLLNKSSKQLPQVI